MCEYIESCGLHKTMQQVRWGDEIKKFKSYYCYGDEHAVSECNHRELIIKIQNLEKQLASLTK